MHIQWILNEMHGDDDTLVLVEVRSVLSRKHGLKEVKHQMSSPHLVIAIKSKTCKNKMRYLVCFRHERK